MVYTYICWTKGFINVVVYTDYIKALNLLLRGYENSHNFFDISLMLGFSSMGIKMYGFLIFIWLNFHM